MDISIIGKNNLKLKGKQVVFIVDPSKEMLKTTGDAVILLNGFSNVDTSRVIDSRITINGAGEYEVAGTKVSGTQTPNGIIYKLSIDDISIVLGRVGGKIEGISDCQIAIINADGEFNESFVTALEPKITVLYGDKKIESAKTLGTESITPVSKITVTKDKLPEKMEIIVLG